VILRAPPGSGHGFVALLLLVAAPRARAQEEEPIGGRVGGVEWTAGLDATLAGFGYGNPVFANERPDASGDLSGGWFEGFAEPWVGAEIGAGRSRFTGDLSLLWTWTAAAADQSVGGNADAFRLEQANIGWASGDLWPGLGTDAVIIHAGRLDFDIGTGMLMQLGGSNGGDRGAYYLAPRVAWDFGAVARFATGPHAVRGFYLEPDVAAPEESARFAGLDYAVELAGGKVESGATWFQVFDAADPAREGLSVVDIRAAASPLSAVPDLRFSGELASERNDDVLRAWGWYLAAEYAWSEGPWSPSFGYRYAVFDGDDPITNRSESFDPLRYGFTDYGSWYQGEVFGIYLLSNSDLRSHQATLLGSPVEALGLRLVVWNFDLDRPAMLASGAEVRHLGGEVDLIVEWEVTPVVAVNLVATRAWLDDLLEAEFDRSGALSYLMTSVGLSF